MDKNTVKKIVNEYLNNLEENNIHFEKAYLFGSFAKNKADENSDIDIALIFRKVNKKYELLLELMKLRRNIDLRIEPHPIALKDFNDNSFFANEILKYGVELNRVII